MRNSYALSDSCPKICNLDIDSYSFHFDFVNGTYNEPKLTEENEYIFFDERVLALKKYIILSQQECNANEREYKNAKEQVEKLIPGFFMG